MIAAILTNAPLSYAVRQLADVGGLRGHEMVIVDYRQYVRSSFGRGSDSTSFKDWCERFKAFFAWLDPQDLHCGLNVMREFEASGVYSPNTSEAVAHVCNRFSLAQMLGQAGLPMPPSIFVHSTENAAELLDSIGDGPFVLKRLAGSRTFDQVVVTETREKALLAIDQQRKQNRDFLLQRYVAETNGSDLRVLVVGGHAIAAILRTARGNADFPSLGFSVMSSKLSELERSLAERAASAFDLEIADVTLLRSNQGPLVLDLKPFPQLEWWDKHGSSSVANQMFELIELQATIH